MKDVLTGDLISPTTIVGTFDFRVESTRKVNPDQVEVIADTDEPLLTLVTCWPFNFIGHAPKRFIVARATLAPPGNN